MKFDETETDVEQDAYCRGVDESIAEIDDCERAWFEAEETAAVVAID